MVRGVKIPLVRCGVKIEWIRGSKYHGQEVQYIMHMGSIYHWQGGQNTIAKGFDIPQIDYLIYNEQGPLYTIYRGSKYNVEGFDIPWVGGQNTMGRGFNIPWVGVSIYLKQGVRYIMGSGSKYHGQRFVKPYIVGLTYHGQGARYSMDRGVKIPWIANLIYHGSEARYTMHMEFDISWVGGQTIMGRGFNIPQIGV